MEYIIYHPYGGTLNHRCERGQHEFKQVATVEASSLEMAFIEAQNHTNMKYCSLGLRSTCVGDIITAPDNTHHMVMPVGFQEVPHTVLSYIDWSNHVHTADPKQFIMSEDFVNMNGRYSPESVKRHIEKLVGSIEKLSGGTL